MNETIPFSKTNPSTRDLASSNSAMMASGPLVSDEVRRIFQWVVFAVACEIVDIFGTITNIINIICFVKQGFKDPINVSLLGLSISDLGCLATLIFTNICFNPLFQESDIPFESVEIQYLVTGWPHVIFTRVTSCITALITLERCLCITMPLKVKTIFTPKRVTIIIILLFTLLICSVSPVYYANGFGWRFSPRRNRTILGLVFTPDREKVETVSFAINNIFVPCSAFVVVIVCTIKLVVNLRSKSKWREKSTLAGQAQAASTRDQKVTRMVVVISALFIACFFPVCVIFIAMLIVPELSISGKYRNTFFIVFGFGFLLESTNSAMNIFIYYNMSSKYRAVFHQIFRMQPSSE